MWGVRRKQREKFDVRGDAAASELGVLDSEVGGFQKLGSGARRK